MANAYKTFMMTGGILALLAASPAWATPPVVQSAVAVIGKANRDPAYSTIKVRPTYMTLKINGTNLRGGSDKARVQLVKLNPDGRVVVLGKLGAKPKAFSFGSGVLFWSETTLGVSLDLMFQYPDIESLENDATGDLLAVMVRTPGNGWSAPFKITAAFRYDLFPLIEDEGNDFYTPIELAHDPDSDKVYVNFEAARNPQWCDADGNMGLVDLADINDNYTTPLFAMDGNGQTWKSYGEDVEIGGGRIWFAQGGQWDYHGPLVSKSRIVSYEPGTGEIHDYAAIPAGSTYQNAGDKEPAFGLLYEADEGSAGTEDDIERLWFTSFDEGTQCFAFGGTYYSCGLEGQICYANQDMFYHCPGRGSAISILNLKANPPTVDKRFVLSPAVSSSMTHLTMDKAGDIWFSTQIGAPVIGRFHKEECLSNPSTCTVDVYPVRQPPVGVGGSQGWEIKSDPTAADDGAIIINSQGYATLSRFNVDDMDGANCDDTIAPPLTSNPCMTTFQITLEGNESIPAYSTSFDLDPCKCAIWYDYRAQTGGFFGSTDPAMQRYNFGIVRSTLTGTNTPEGLLTLPPIDPFESSTFYGQGLQVLNNWSGIDVTADGVLWASNFFRRTLVRLTPLKWNGLCAGAPPAGCS